LLPELLTVPLKSGFVPVLPDTMVLSSVAVLLDL
jgi:hypothetical protein